MTILEKRRSYILEVLRECRGSYLSTFDVHDALFGVNSKVYGFDVLEVLHGLHRDGIVLRLDRVKRNNGKCAYGWAVPLKSQEAK